MKYNLYVNQVMAIELGIKNINQAHVFDLLSTASTWATTIDIDGEIMFWVSRQKVCRELELLSIKPDTVYRHLKALDDLGLINYKKDGLKDCISLTTLGKTYHSDTPMSPMSETNPSEEVPYVGNESEQTRKQIREDSEIDPIYPTTKHTTTNTLQGRALFKPFYDSYKGTKRALSTEFKTLVNLHEDWPDVLTILEEVKLEYPKDETYIPMLKNFLRDRLWESSKKIKVKQWWESKQGLVEKGKEYGLKELDFRHFQKFRYAVLNKAKEKGEMVA